MISMEETHSEDRSWSGHQTWSGCVVVTDGKDLNIPGLSWNQPAPDALRAPHVFRAHNRRDACLDLCFATGRAIVRGTKLSPAHPPPHRHPYGDAKYNRRRSPESGSWGVWRAHSRMLFPPTALTMAAPSWLTGWHLTTTYTLKIE